MLGVAFDQTIPNAWAAMRMTRQASGRAAKPRRRVTKVDRSVSRVRRYADRNRCQQVLSSGRVANREFTLDEPRPRPVVEVGAASSMSLQSTSVYRLYIVVLM
jgi:hypothetical protein